MIEVELVESRPGFDVAGRPIVRAEFRIDAPDVAVFHVEVTAADPAAVRKAMRRLGMGIVTGTW